MAYLRKQGEGELTAGDIEVPAGVEIHNPELHLATLNARQTSTLSWLSSAVAAT